MKKYTDYLVENFQFLYCMFLVLCIGYKIALIQNHEALDLVSIDASITAFLFLNLWVLLVAFYKWWKQDKSVFSNM